MCERAGATRSPGFVFALMHQRRRTEVLGSSHHLGLLLRLSRVLGSPHLASDSLRAFDASKGYSFFKPPASGAAVSAVYLDGGSKPARRRGLSALGYLSKASSLRC